MEMYHIKNIDVCFFVNDSGNKEGVSRYSAIMCYLTNNGYDQSHCTSQAGVFSS